MKSMLAGCLIYLAGLFPLHAQQVNVSRVFGDVEKQTQLMLQNIPAARKGNAELVSPKTIEKGELKMIASREWTSGFFPGQLWFLYEFSAKEEWKKKVHNIYG